MPRYVLAFAALACLLAAAAPAVRAQEPGVFIDPDSPTGVEYDIPLERARRQASSSPETGSAAFRSRSETLFGEGIGSPDAKADGTAGSGGEASGETGSGRRPARDHARPSESVDEAVLEGRRRRGGRGRGGQKRAPKPVQAALARPGAPDGVSGLLIAGGMAALVLTAGIAGGFALRRRGRGD